MTAARLRDRYLAFIDRHDIAWELGMAALRWRTSSLVWPQMIRV
jgi:hypothetical protein